MLPLYKHTPVLVVSKIENGNQSMLEVFSKSVVLERKCSLTRVE